MNKKKFSPDCNKISANGFQKQRNYLCGRYLLFKKDHTLVKITVVCRISDDKETPTL
jgi:hypothetical protein